MANRTEELSGIEGEGVAPKKIKRLDNAINAWRSHVTERMDILEKEVAARDKVVAIMHEEGLTSYPYWITDDEKKLVVLDSTEKLMMKKASDGEPSETDVDDD